MPEARFGLRSGRACAPILGLVAGLTRCAAPSSVCARADSQAWCEPWCHPMKFDCPPCGSQNACGSGTVGIVAARSTSAGALVEGNCDGFRADGFFFTAVGADFRAGFLDAAFFGATLDFARTGAFTFFALR